ncbi:MAG: DUF3303 domain-containing protein [Methanosarcina sp.]|jgi:hypothetical protein
MENMLLLDITTFEPEQGMELFKRWELVENMELPKGLKVINQWFDAGGGRAVTLYDVETIEDYMAYNFPFTDLCHVEVFPVMEAGNYKKFAAQQMEKLSSLYGNP